MVCLTSYAHLHFLLPGDAFKIGLYIFSNKPAYLANPEIVFDTIQLATTTAVYKKIGVSYVNKFTQNGDIMNGLIRKQFPHYKIISKNTVSINKLLKQTYIFEKFHCILFLFYTLATIYAFIQNYWLWTLIIFLTNIAYNIYPNLLQQYIRIRLTNLLKRQQAISSGRNVLF
ncbi:MAG: hypothetical protein ABIN89_20150 [Chitinophagaceae bacterium]